MSKLRLSNHTGEGDADLNGNGRALSPLAPVAANAPAYAAPLRLEEDDDTVDLGRYLKALKRRWPIALGTLVAVVACGFVLTALQKPIYRSAAQILVSTPGGGSGDAAEVINVLGAPTQTRSLGQQLAIIKAPSVQRGAFNRLAPGQREQLNPYFKSDIIAQPEAEAIQVQVDARHAGAAAAFANAICAEYIDQSQEQNRAQVRATTRYVEEQRGVVGKQLDAASKALKAYREAQGTIDLDAESKALIGEVGALESNRRQLEAQRVGNQAQIADINAQINKISPDAQVPTAIVRSGKAETLKGQLTTLQLQRIATTREYRENSRQVQDIDKQIADINAQLKSVAETQVSSWVPNPIRQNLVQQRATLQGQIWANEAQKRALDSSIAESRQSLSGLPERAYRLGKLLTDQATLQQTYQTLNEKYQSLRISEEARVANARVITPAEPSGSPIAPRKGFNLALSFALGLLLAVAAALLADRLDDRVHGDEDVEGVTGLPILSHVAAIKEEGNQLLAGHTGTSPLLESFRMLRTNIAFAGLDEPLRSLVITSSQPGEGKSTSAANMATVMALGGKNVILVDCDLRRPTLHKVFGLPNTVGFSSVAAGLASLEEAIQETKVPGLRVLTSGPIPPNPPELLDSRGGRRTLQAVIDQSEFAVFDCPPALILTDAQIVATCADAVLLVVSSNEANKRDIARTSRLMSQAGAKMLGVLFNKVTESASRYGYYKYGGKYSTYGGYFDKPGEGETVNGTGRLSAAEASGSAGKGHVATPLLTPIPPSEESHTSNGHGPNGQGPGR